MTCDSLSVEEEAHTLGRLALSLAEGIHEFLELSGALDLEEDLVVVIRDLDVQMLRGLWLIFRLVAGWGAVIRHIVVCVGDFVGWTERLRSGPAESVEERLKLRIEVRRAIL